MILNYLKEHTNSIHHRVEQNSLAKFILDQTISKENYLKFLIQNFNFYYTIEKELSKNRPLIAASMHPFIGNQKSKNLEKDLQSMDYDVEQLKSKSYAYQILSEEAALGALYVSEGSVLGGLVISKHLPTCPELQFIQQHYFFGKDIPSILERWKGFREVVEHHYIEGTMIKEKVLKSAMETFELFDEIIAE